MFGKTILSARTSRKCYTFAERIVKRTNGAKNLSLEQKKNWNTKHCMGLALRIMRNVRMCARCEYMPKC